MLVVGLTGGIGAGKSTVAQMFSEYGAVIVDADLIARDVVRSGSPAYGEIVEQFGPEVVSGGGELNRAALAKRVFADPEARVRLERITHPAIQAEIARQTAAHMTSDRIVILDIPLLKEKREPMAAIVVVDVSEDVAVSRLVGRRGFDEADARARVASQLDRAQRRALADIVIDNGGDEAALRGAVARAWQQLCALAGGDG